MTDVGQATALGQTELNQKGVDGVFGLGFANYSDSGTYKIPAPLVTAYNKQYFQTPCFTVYLKTVGYGNENVAGAGEIVFGSIGDDNVNCGPLIGSVLLASNTSQYAVSLDSVVVGTTSAYFGGPTSNDSLALFDSGQSIILGPAYAIASIANAIGATKLSNQDYYSIDCNAQYTVSFTFLGKPYNLTQSVLTRPFRPNLCRLAMDAMSSNLAAVTGVQWSIGDVFYRQYCTAFCFKPPLGVGPRILGFMNIL